VGDSCNRFERVFGGLEQRGTSMRFRALTMSLLLVVLVLGLFAAPAMAGVKEVYPPPPPPHVPPEPPPVTPPKPPPVTPPDHPTTGVDDMLFLVLSGGALLGLGVVAVRGVKRPVPQG
jgi:LPXTG-motif cell wall-anchored protein